MGVGQKIKIALSQRKMTVKQLAEITGMSVNTLYSITKKDTVAIRADNLIRIARALGMHPTEFFTKQNADSETETYLDPFSMIDFTNSITHTDHLPNKKAILVALFDGLNDAGQGKAVESLSLLTRIPEYQLRSKEQP